MAKFMHRRFSNYSVQVEEDPARFVEFNEFTHETENERHIAVLRREVKKDPNLIEVGEPKDKLEEEAVEFVDDKNEEGDIIGKNPVVKGKGGRPKRANLSGDMTKNL